MRIMAMNWKPSERVLRQFGFIALAGFGGLALAAWNERLWFAGGLGASRVALTSILAGLAALCLAASLVAPRANRPLFIGLSLLSYPIGFVVSYVIMAVLFYLVFAPVGIVMRMLGRDPLSRKADASALSYWLKVEDRKDPNRYFRQF